MADTIILTPTHDTGARTKVLPMVSAPPDRVVDDDMLAAELPDAIPFPDDTTHSSYDADAVQRFWRALVEIERVMKVFRSRFVGKASPIHFFWGAIDHAYTRFSGRTAPPHPGGAPNCGPHVMWEAYSHEVSSAGYWPGGPGEEGTFRYDADKHWVGPVAVLDFQHPNDTAEGGLEVGDAYLRHLAGHPATAQTIAHKLAVRFVSDTPPPELVERLATSYLDNGTAIVPVLDTLFRSVEFWAAVGQKTRRPLENVTASVRILGVVPDGDPVHSIGRLYNATTDSGHRPLSWPAPNGYPDVHAAWRSAGNVVAVWNLHRASAIGRTG